MSGQRTILSRHWVPIVGGSCDVRMGVDALGSAAKVLRDSVSKPHLCAIVVRSDEDADVVDELERQATDAGFTCRVIALEEPFAHVDAVPRLAGEFARLHLTGDDLCCVVGDAAILSLVSCVCGAWCSSTSMVAVPQDEPSLFEGVLTPRPLDVGDAHGVFAVRASIRHAIFDYTRALTPVGEEPARYARVLMVGAAVSSSEKEFSALWDKAPALMRGDEDERIAQLVATAKSRGKIAASTTAVVRSALDYGQTFARACARLVTEVPHSLLVGEGMRFCARIAVAQGKLSVDDMLAQDELLDELGIVSVSCDVSPDALMEAIRAEKRLRSRRALWEVPLALGRVRLATVEGDMLAEHVRAWCASHTS